MSNSKTKDTKEADLIGQILSEELHNVDYKQKPSFIFERSVSAPPPGLIDPLFLDQNTTDENDPTATQEYYEYYHSLKPLDPRMPKPKWKPYLYGAGNLITPINFPVINEENQDINKLRKGSMPEKYSNTGEFINQFEKSLSLSKQNSSNNKQFSPLESDSLSTYSNNSKTPTTTGGPYENTTTATSSARYSNDKGGRYENQQQSPQQHQQTRHHHNMKTQNQTQNYGGQNMNQIPHMGMGMGMMSTGIPQNPMYSNQYNMYAAQQQVPFYANYNQQQYANIGMNANMNLANSYQGNQFYPTKGMSSHQPQMNYDYMAGNMGYGNIQGDNSIYQQGYMYQQQQPQLQPRKLNPNLTSNQYHFSNVSFHNNYYHPNSNFPMSNQNQNNMQGSYYKSQSGGHQKNFNKGLPTKIDMRQLLPKILEYCQDQNGSRLIQQHFENASDQDREAIFEKIKPHIYNLITDVFGNYVIQKIIELGTAKMIGNVFEAMKGKVLELSLNTYGCRVVQKILEAKQKQDDILNDLKPHVLKCIEDQNGNHVIQKCFETIAPQKLQFIVNEVIKNINELAFHPYGCRVIQRILEYSKPDETSPILKSLMGSIIPLCECQYGNYIIQHLIEKGPEPEKDLLYETLKKNFVKLSQNKFASNVTEKSVIHGSMDFKREVLKTLINKSQDDNSALFMMMNHPFGNYVVQRLFESGDDSLKKKMFQKIQTFDLNEIRKNQYGKHVLGFIEKYMDDNQKSMNNINV